MGMLCRTGILAFSPTQVYQYVYVYNVNNQVNSLGATQVCSSRISQNSEKIRKKTATNFLQSTSKTSSMCVCVSFPSLQVTRYGGRLIFK